MKRKNIMKLLSLLFVLGVTLIPTHSKAADYTNLTVTEISDMATFDTVTPQLYNQPIAPLEKQYYTFTLTEDSWLYYRFNLSDETQRMLNCSVYKNEYLTNKVADITFIVQDQMSAFYPKGTYYLVLTGDSLYSTTYSMTVASIPCSKVFEPIIQYSADKKSATVSYKNPYSTNFEDATYINKEVLPKDVDDFDTWYDGTKVEENPNNGLIFTVTENGTYTFKIVTRTRGDASSYSKVFQINGIEKTKEIKEPETTEKAEETKKAKTTETAVAAKTEETKEPETTVVAKAQTIKVKAAKTLKFKKKKKITYKLNAKVADNAKLSYKVVSTPKKAKHMIRVNKKGLVTFKKAAKKGTYKIKITAAKTANYRSAVKTVTLKIK